MVCLITNITIEGKGREGKGKLDWSPSSMFVLSVERFQ
jgi:hypothetical protein